MCVCFYYYSQQMARIIFSFILLWKWLHLISIVGKVMCTIRWSLSCEHTLLYIRANNKQKQLDEPAWMVWCVYVTYGQKKK